MSGGWGAGSWGEIPWGGGAIPTPADIVAAEKVFVSAVNIWATDLVEVIFSVPMKVNSTMRNPSSFSFAPTSDGIPVTVREVRAGPMVVTTRLFLVVSAASLGSDYDVSVIGDVRSAYNNPIAAPITKRIRAHRTKTDSMLAITPGMYDGRPEAVYRNLLNAIGHADHLIGGDILVSEK